MPPPSRLASRNFLQKLLTISECLLVSSGLHFSRAQRMYCLRKSIVMGGGPLFCWGRVVYSTPSYCWLQGWLWMCSLMTKVDSASSISGSISSLTTLMMSKRERMGSDRSTFQVKLIWGLYRPWRGLAAAMTEHRARRVVTMPALEMEIDCCSIASWMEVRSCSFILSNSSIRHMPLSARTKAPASSFHSPVEWSLLTLAVRPTAEAPLPVVQMERQKTFWTLFRNCDLAMPGSPNSSTLISPLTLWLPSATLSTPPNMARDSALLMLQCPQIEGAIDWQIFSSMFLSSLANSIMLSSVSWSSSNFSVVRFLTMALASMRVVKMGKPYRALMQLQQRVMKMPVTSMQSPGRAMSMLSPQSTTSLVRGMRPGRTQLGDYCRVIFWQLRYTVFCFSIKQGPFDWQELQEPSETVFELLRQKGPFSWPHLVHLQIILFS